MSLSTRPRIKAADFACRVEEFAKKNAWVRGQLKALVGPAYPVDRRKYGYCALGYEVEVANQLSLKGYLPASIRQARRAFRRRVVEAIVGQKVSVYNPSYELEAVISHYNDKEAIDKADVVDKFHYACKVLKNRTRKVVTK